MSIIQAKEKYEAQLMQLPNVAGISIGEKGGKEVIKVYVTQKLPLTALRLPDVIPGVLGGYETDVEEIGTVTAQNE